MRLYNAGSADMGDIFKELPHSLEAVDTTSVSAPGPKDVTKVLASLNIHRPFSAPYILGCQIMPCLPEPQGMASWVL